MMLRNLSVLLLASSLLAACSKPAAPSKSGNTPATPPTNTAPAAPAAATPAEKKVFKFTAIPNDKPTELEKFKKLAAYLTKEMGGGVEFEYIPTAKYDASLDQFVNGNVQMAWFGGVTGVLAMNKVAGSRAIARGVEDATFHSYFIANKSTSLTKSDAFPAGIAGKTFTFGSEKSTSGRVMPEYFIKQNTGKKPEELFAKVGFSGDHSKTIEQVGAGTFEVGVVDYKKYDDAVAKKAPGVENTVIIWDSPAFVDYQFTVQPDLDKVYGEGFTAKLQQAIIGIQDKDILGLFPREKFVESKNEEFAIIKQVLTEVGIK